MESISAPALLKAATDTDAQQPGNSRAVADTKQVAHRRAPKSPGLVGGQKHSRGGRIGLLGDVVQQPMVHDVHSYFAICTIGRNYLVVASPHCTVM